MPKEVEAEHLKKFRPISLINYSFKVFAKALNNRLIKLADRDLFWEVWLLLMKSFMIYT
jgi:hypothetical protein